MSQFAFDPYASPVRETNGLGIAGFVVSLLGLLGTVGMLCPIGLILSLIALGRRPRGFAVAGVIIGAIGSCGAIVLGLLLIAGVISLVAIAAALGLAIMISEPEKVEISSEMARIAVAVSQYKEENRYVPADLNVVNLPSNITTDPWGTSYRYLRLEDGKSFDIVSAGKDKAFDSGDDLRFSRLDKIWAGQHRIHVGSGPNGGEVQIEFGDKKVNVAGGDQGGTVTVEAGGRTIQIKGDQNGGSIDSGTQPASQPSG